MGDHFLHNPGFFLHLYFVIRLVTMRLQSHAALQLIPLAQTHQLVSDDADASVLRLLHLVATLHRA
jgi:hypothetical protein